MISAPSHVLSHVYRGGTTWTGDFKCRKVKTGFCRNRSMQTGSSKTLIGWKSGQATFVPPWDRMEGAWLWTQYTVQCSHPQLLWINPSLWLHRAHKVWGRGDDNKQTNSWILNDLGRNSLLGKRKKIAKFLMRTFTYRSTFLYGG